MHDVKAWGKRMIPFGVSIEKRSSFNIPTSVGLQVFLIHLFEVHFVEEFIPLKMIGVTSQALAILLVSGFQDILVGLLSTL